MTISFPVSYLGVGDGPSGDFQNLRDETRYGFGRPNFTTRGQIVVPVHFRGTTSNDMAQNYQRLVRKVRQAEKAWWERAVDKRVVFTWQPRTTFPVYFDVIGGSLTPLHINPGSHSGECQLTLKVLPYPRGETVTDTVTGTLTNGSAQFLRPNIIGDHPALVKLRITDTSPAGAINRIRLGLRSEQEIDALGDYDPWLDVSLLSGASSTADATAFGGSYVHRTSTLASWSDLGVSVMLAGALNRGRRDIWARVFDTATAMAAPTGQAATAARAGITRRQSATDTSGAIAPAFPSATLSGSTLVGIVAGANSAGSEMSPGSGPAGYSLVSALNSDLDRKGNVAAMDVFGAAYVNHPAGVTSGGQSMSVTGETLGAEAGFVAELTGSVGLIGEMGAVAGFNVTDLPMFTPPSVPCLLIAYAVSASGGAIIGSGFTAAMSSGILTVATKYVTSDAPFRLSVTTSGNEAVMCNMLAFGEVEPTEGYDLEAGAYSFRVQAVDPNGVLSNASGNAAVTPTVGDNAITLGWTAPAGTVSYYKITYSFGGMFYYFYTPTNATSYTLTSIDGHPSASGFPATSGAVGSPARLRARIGTLGSPTAELMDLDEVVLTGEGVWRLVKIASAKNLPPVGMHLNGSRPDWVIETQMRSVNGLDATVRLDGLWVVPHDEWQATLQVADPTFSHTTPRRWVIETDRSGRSMTGWLENIGSGAEVGAIDCSSVFLLEPGDNIILLALEGEGEEVDLTLRCTVELSWTPRYDWMAGGLE
jgi:hypothetical protein